MNIPSNEAQARELAPLVRDDPETARTVWREVNEEHAGTVAAACPEQLPIVVIHEHGLPYTDALVVMTLGTFVNRIGDELCASSERAASVAMKGW